MLSLKERNKLIEHHFFLENVVSRKSTSKKWTKKVTKEYKELLSKLTIMSLSDYLKIKKINRPEIGFLPIDKDLPNQKITNVEKDFTILLMINGFRKTIKRDSQTLVEVIK